MPRPPVEVAGDVIRTAGESFYEQSQQWFTWLHLKVLNAILLCRNRPRSADMWMHVPDADIRSSLSTHALAPGE